MGQGRGAADGQELLSIARLAVSLAVEILRADRQAMGCPLVVPSQRTYPLEEVRSLYAELEAGHMGDKIVLIP